VGSDEIKPIPRNIINSFTGFGQETFSSKFRVLFHTIAQSEKMLDIKKITYKRDKLLYFIWWRACRLPEIQSPQRQHIKNPLVTMRYEFARRHSSRPAAGNVFLHIFPKQRMDAGSIPTAISLAMFL